MPPPLFPSGSPPAPKKRKAGPAVDGVGLLFRSVPPPGREPGGGTIRLLSMYMFRERCKGFCGGNDTRTQEIIREGLYCLLRTHTAISCRAPLRRAHFGDLLFERDPPEVGPIEKGSLGNDNSGVVWTTVCRAWPPRLGPGFPLAPGLSLEVAGRGAGGPNRRRASSGPWHQRRLTASQMRLEIARDIEGFCDAATALLPPR